jgi:hypothetical protein
MGLMGLMGEVRDKIADVVLVQSVSNNVRTCLNNRGTYWLTWGIFPKPYNEGEVPGGGGHLWSIGNAQQLC